jgi:dinuclear metal center YbgI/SA1388 family protein
MQIKDVTQFLESLAPLSFQEDYDNSGLLTGDQNDSVNGILVTLDCTEEIVKEAIQTKCNLIVAHHPIVFKGLKKLTGSNYVERTIISAIRNNIAIYAIHTNLDNVITGVNHKICEKLGLSNLSILSEKPGTLSKLVSFAPKKAVDDVLEAMYLAGAGKIGNYSNCSFQLEGTGTFLPNEGANPTIGNIGKSEHVEEVRMEVLVPEYLQNTVISALKSSHPYEEVAYYLTPLLNSNQDVGSGMMGEFEKPLEPKEFLRCLKENMELTVIRHTAPLAKSIKKVAVCGGAGSFLLKDAIKRGADAFVSADFKYHEFFDADNRIMIADIGHYESEVYTKELLKEVLMKKFPSFAINFSRSSTNPISYYK